VDLVTYQVPSLQPSVEGEDINDRRQPGNGCKRRQVSLTPQTPSSSSPYQASSVSNNMRRRPQSRKAKSLAQRIIAAAVLSHVNPHKDIASATSSRHPLPLVSGHRGLASPSGVVRKHQTRNLVDPRKTVPFRQATFSSGTCRDHLNTPRTTRQKPLTKWNTVYDPETPGKLRSRKARNPQGVQQRALHCPPLRFIPVHDAEQAYASKVLLSG
jgi:hypothetical protein